MIRIIQCMCPKRHAILAICYDTELLSPTEARLNLQDIVDGLVTVGILNRRCEICDADVEFRYDDGATTFASIDEAKPHILRLEEEQILTRARAIARRMAMKN